jgi:ribosomal-protein-alanine N-acetyltransferase
MTTGERNVVSSQRLDLVLLEERALELVIERRGEELEGSLGGEIPAEWLDAALPMARMRREQIREDPSATAWLLRAIVLRDERKVIGYVNFHGPPSPEGWAEIGYEILPAYRRRGIATETARAMFDWAHSQHGVTRFRASIGPANTASLGMIRKLGFTRTGVQWDEIDGEEIVFERDWPPTP